MNKTNIQYIENAGIRVGILIEIGGTIAYVSKNGSENLINSNSDLWDNAKKPPVNEFAGFMPYNGHTIWVGPQSDWWTQQNINSERLKNKDIWPPDPFISYGTYTILFQNENSIKIQSPPSPVSNIQIEKEIAINPDGSIFQTVRFFNMSERTVKWDIWFNTRLSGYARAYVNVSKENAKIKHVLNANSTEMDYEFIHDYFTYLPSQPPKEFEERSSKTFIYPNTPNIFAFTNKHLFQISFELHKKNEIHPEQGHVEIYNHTETNIENSLLELEYHSPYKTLNPGDTIEAWEVWEIESCDIPNTTKDHISYLLNK